MIPVQSTNREAYMSDLKRRVRSLFWQRGGASLSNVDVQLNSDKAVTAVLHGTVNSFYERQLCLACCKHVPGIANVEDRIHVKWPDRKAG